MAPGEASLGGLEYLDPAFDGIASTLDNRDKNRMNPTKNTLMSTGSGHWTLGPHFHQLFFRSSMTIHSTYENPEQYTHFLDLCCVVKWSCQNPKL